VSVPGRTSGIASDVNFALNDDAVSPRNSRGTRLARKWSAWHALTSGKGVVGGPLAHRSALGVPHIFTMFRNWPAVLEGDALLTGTSKSREMSVPAAVNPMDQLP
jgi:hypothetical protein